MRTRAKLFGFAIVELLVVFVLIVILLVTALPRFVDRDMALQQAQYDGAFAALQAGVALFHAQWIADGQPTDGPGYKAFGNLFANEFGFPAGTADERGRVIATNKDCAQIFAGLVPKSLTVGEKAGVTELPLDLDFLAEAVDVRHCRFYYLGFESRTLGQPPSILYNAIAGTVSRDVSKLDG